ncbi:para-aminobenzoate synthase, (PABA) [Malassezia pachydermatis]
MDPLEALPRIVIVDHHDSYTRNLLYLISKCFDPEPSPELLVSRVAVIPHTHPALSPHTFEDQVLPHIDAVILSPGPGTSETDSDFGTSLALLQDEALHDLPFLGVCLGHQGLATGLGATIKQLKEPFHGRKRKIVKEQGWERKEGFCGIMDGVPDGTEVICYNSLVVEEESLPSCLRVTSRSIDDHEDIGTIVQSMEHESLPRYGVQFHPESIETTGGTTVLSNFLHNVREIWNQKDPARVRSWKDANTCLPYHIRSLGSACVALGTSIGICSPRWRVLSKSVPASATTLEHVIAYQFPYLAEMVFRNGCPNCIWLDSASPRDPQSNVSTLTNADFYLHYDMAGCLTVHHPGEDVGKHPGVHLDLAAYTSLWHWMDQVQRTMQAQTRGLEKSEKPSFRTGFAGFWSYEMKDESLSLGSLHPDKYRAGNQGCMDRSKLPAAYWAFCSRVLCFDHETRTWNMHALVDEGGKTSDAISALERSGVTLGLSEEDALTWFQCVETKLQDTTTSTMTVSPLPPITLHGLDNAEVYMQKIEKARELISMGESYEICLTTQFEGKVLEEADYNKYFALYCSLRRKNPAPFSAYVELPTVHGTPQAILSTSPERFLTVSDRGTVEMRPIKGTKVRPGWGAGEEDWLARAKEEPDMRAFVAAEDRRRRQLLEADPKERAENLMIADLIRADLQSVCFPGTVEVPRLIALETYVTVHQLVTSVEGTLRPSIGCVDVTRRCFPPGSMTGAPKRRSVELIETLERSADDPESTTRRRGIYSGALGFIGVDGASSLSVVIRTITMQGANALVGAGGAITFLSSPEGEWDEVLTKLGSVASLAPSK